MEAGVSMHHQRQDERRRIDARHPWPKFQLGIFAAAQKYAGAKGQQQVGDDGPADAGLDHVNQPLVTAQR